MPTVDGVWTVVGWSCQAAPENTTHHRAAHRSPSVLRLDANYQLREWQRDLSLRRLAQQRVELAQEPLRCLQATSENSLQHVKWLLLFFFFFFFNLGSEFERS